MARRPGAEGPLRGGGASFKAGPEALPGEPEELVAQDSARERSAGLTCGGYKEGEQGQEGLHKKSLGPGRTGPGAGGARGGPGQNSLSALRFASGEFQRTACS